MSRSIITTVEGGLGNQLFQYFAARWISEKLGGQVLLDTAPLAQRTLRRYILGQFHIPQKFCSAFHRLALRATQSHKARLLWRSGFFWLPGSQVTLIKEGASTLNAAALT